MTLHRLGVFGTLGRSLKTTKCLESLNAQLGQLTDKVDRWRTSEQKHRWVASALVEIEPRLRRIKGYRHLPQLQAALDRECPREHVTTACLACSQHPGDGMDDLTIVDPGANTEAVFQPHVREPSGGRPSDMIHEGGRFAISTKNGIDSTSPAALC